MIMNNIRLKRKIMWRIKSVYILNQILSPINLKLFSILILLYIGGKLVFVAEIFNNMPVFSDFGGVIHFSYSAFVHTELIVQFVCLLGFSMIIWFFRDLLSRFIFLKQE